MKHQPYDYYISGNMVDQHILQISRWKQKSGKKLGTFTKKLLVFPLGYVGCFDG